MLSFLGRTCCIMRFVSGICTSNPRPCIDQIIVLLSTVIIEYNGTLFAISLTHFESKNKKVIYIYTDTCTKVINIAENTYTCISDFTTPSMLRHA